MKLLPESVTVLPAYATAGSADSTAGLALICSSDAALVALVVEGFEKFTLTPQLPALSDPEAVISRLEPSTIEQLAAATPQTTAEQTWLL